MAGAVVQNQADLEALALWPKLFRRLTTYFGDGNTGMSNWDAWLRADRDRDDELWIILQACLANMHDVIAVTRNRVSMRFWPEELMMTPR